MSEIEILKNWAEKTLFEDKVNVTIFRHEEDRTIYRLRDARLGNKSHRTGLPILAIIKDGKPVLLSSSEVWDIMASSF